MAELWFPDRLYKAVMEKKSILCLGMDPQLWNMPQCVFTDELARSALGDLTGWTLRDFVRDVIHAVRDHVVAIKFNTAFFVEHGAAGMEALAYGQGTARMLGLLVLNDAKCDDGDDTAVAHSRGHIGLVTKVADNRTLVQKPSPIRVDAVTIEPRLGDNCFDPFLDDVRAHGTGVFVFVRTSFKKLGGIEDLELKGGGTVWQYFARQTAVLAAKTSVGMHGYCGIGAVVGANNRDDVDWIRDLLRESWFLKPGVGAQGADFDDAVRGANRDGSGILVNSGRSIINAGIRGREASITRKEWLAAAERAARATKDGLNAAFVRARTSL